MEWQRVNLYLIAAVHIQVASTFDVVGSAMQLVNTE